MPRAFLKILSWIKNQIDIMISIIFCSKDAPESDLLLKHVSELIDTMHFFFPLRSQWSANVPRG